MIRMKWFEDVGKTLDMKHRKDFKLNCNMNDGVNARFGRQK